MFSKLTQNSGNLRYLFFAIGVIAVIAVTGMNVYSLYALRESTIESVEESYKSDLEDFSNEVRYRFYRPFWGISKLDMEYLQFFWNKRAHFPKRFREVLAEASQDSMFKHIYYLPENSDGCQNPADPVFKYDSEKNEINRVSDLPDIVCDGFGLSRTNVKTLKGDFKYNTKVTFDSHHSMTLALINLTDMEVVGHVNFVIDKYFLVNNFLQKQLTKKYGKDEKPGLVVWLRDWREDRILISTDESVPFSRDNINIKQRFPDLLDGWVLYASFTESPTIEASNASLYRNLVVLGLAVIFLIGALLYMFITAQRERELAKRQAGFLANVTHELKTPLAVMQAAGENIADGRVTEGKRLQDYGNHIYTEAIRLRKMIEKLLDVAKADSGQAVAEFAPRKLDEIVEKFYNQNRDYIKDKGFEVNLNVNKNTPLCMVDADHIDTIWSNLVENAMKYSMDDKRIEITVDSDGQEVMLSVKDYGIGIPDKEQNRIFDKFYRVEDALTAKTKGHGLGLSIVKNLIELNKGSIDLKSKPGEGSEFTVKIPAFLKSDKKTSSDMPKPEKQFDNKEEYAGK